MNILFHKVNVAKHLKTRVRRTKKDKIDIIFLEIDGTGWSLGDFLYYLFTRARSDE